jgi:hypothetical protein
LQELYNNIPTKSGFHELGKQFMIRMLQLMHAVVKLNQDRSRDPVEVIKRARSLDRELEDIKALLPIAWQPQRIRLDTPSDYYQGNLYSICYQPVITQMWNYTRFLSIQIHDIIRVNLMGVHGEEVSPLYNATSLEACIQQEEDTLRANIAAIIAAVPQTTGMVPSPTFSATGIILEEGGKGGPVIREPGTFISSIVSPRLMQLIQPLYAVGTCLLITYDMRQWVINILHFVALRIGSRQAVVLAAELQRLQDSSWKAARGWEDIAAWIALNPVVV